jgi:hypothetical protein
MNKVTCTMRLLGGNDRKASSFSIAMWLYINQFSV